MLPARPDTLRVSSNAANGPFAGSQTRRLPPQTDRGVRAATGRNHDFEGGVAARPSGSRTASGTTPIPAIARRSSDPGPLRTRHGTQLGHDPGPAARPSGDSRRSPMISNFSPTGYDFPSLPRAEATFSGTTGPPSRTLATFSARTPARSGHFSERSLGRPALTAALAPVRAAAFTVPGPTLTHARAPSRFTVTITRTSNPQNNGTQTDARVVIAPPSPVVTGGPSVKTGLEAASRIGQPLRSSDHGPLRVIGWTRAKAPIPVTSGPVLHHRRPNQSVRLDF